jgi:hypothetical protein
VYLSVERWEEYLANEHVKNDIFFNCDNLEIVTFSVIILLILVHTLWSVLPFGRQAIAIRFVMELSILREIRKERIRLSMNLEPLHIIIFLKYKLVERKKIFKLPLLELAPWNIICWPTNSGVWENKVFDRPCWHHWHLGSCDWRELGR